MQYVVPTDSSGLELKVTHLFNGDPCPDNRIWAELSLSRLRDGLGVLVRGPMIHEQRIPEGAIGSRVDGLWEYDVIELFLVGPGHQYLELELGAGGHWLLLSFDSIRHRRDAHERFEPIVRFEKTAQKEWTSSIVIPWRLVPDNVRALNAFAIMGGQFLSLSPLPGTEPDFHQPDLFPSASL